MHKIASVLSSGQHRIQIAGHSDSKPVKTVRFPSNWELSAARAISVAESLIENGVEASRISAVGYADTQPIGDNESETGRSQNRRVELYIKQVQTGSKLEKSVDLN